MQNDVDCTWARVHLHLAYSYLLIITFCTAEDTYYKCHFYHHHWYIIITTTTITTTAIVDALCVMSCWLDFAAGPDSEEQQVEGIQSPRAQALQAKARDSMQRGRRVSGRCRACAW